MNGINSGNAQFLASLDRLQTRADKLQQQISSGFRVSKPSDDPSAVQDVLSLSSAILQTGQVKTNLGIVKADSDAAESSVGTAVQLLQNAVSLAAQGSNTVLTADQRSTIATQVQGLLNQMIGLSRTQVAGRYVFSGDVAAQPQYQANDQNPNGVDRIFQTTATGSVQDSTGVAFPSAHTAEQVFDHRNPDDSLAGDNAFAALKQLATALSNNDQTAIGQATKSLKNAQDWMSQQLGFYGAVQNQVQWSIDMADKYQVGLKADLSVVRDTDVTAAIVESTQISTNVSAAMASQAKVPRTSLFDFLN